MASLQQASLRNPKGDQSPSLSLNRAPKAWPQAPERGFLEQSSPVQGRAGLNFGEGGTGPKRRRVGLSQGGCGQRYLEACFAPPPPPAPGLYHHHSETLRAPGCQEIIYAWLDSGGVSRSLSKESAVFNKANSHRCPRWALKLRHPTLVLALKPDRQPPEKPGFHFLHCSAAIQPPTTPAHTYPV